MIFIADSGSTKCDCLIVDDAGKEHFSGTTMGFNPYFHNEELIYQKLSGEPGIKGLAVQVSRVYYYGAGCSNKTQSAVVEKGLRKVFKNADITVDHDLAGAAFATYEGEEAISAILGTGSNACLFDGRNFYHHHPSVGYLVGDEGSGAHMGRWLLQAYFYRSLEKEISKRLLEEVIEDEARYLKGLYAHLSPNLKLSALSKFMHENIDHPQIREIAKSSFQRFFDLHVLCYDKATTVKTHFVGTVAFHFRDLIVECMHEKQLLPGTFLQKPLQALKTHILEKNFDF